ncbi:MAG: hypothetical protein JJU26_02960 [Oceanicaulis sp.]|uniref:hypothetical protein n=1 Tax=Glycocaulis sp. TaxID=1969725 RepID=UPI0025C2DBE3|nr:hypothetical protein [Glycocaulis sp.]MCC5980659.1 hypothetical protein [Oceanicaulis sp.]MCH8521886.1 hypothetical protein [Glycocaulis sp.]
MSGSDKDFDTRLAALFDEAAPPVDDGFTRAVMEALPRPALTRPAVLTLAGLTGAGLTAWQLPSLVPAVGRLTEILGSAAVDTLGHQALIMALVAAGLTLGTLFLFRRGGLDL